MRDEQLRKQGEIHIQHTHTAGSIESTAANRAAREEEAREEEANRAARWSAHSNEERKAAMVASIASTVASSAGVSAMSASAIAAVAAVTAVIFAVAESKVAAAKDATSEADQLAEKAAAREVEDMVLDVAAVGAVVEGGLVGAVVEGGSRKEGIPVKDVAEGTGATMRIVGASTADLAAEDSRSNEGGRQQEEKEEEQLKKEQQLQSTEEVKKDQHSESAEEGIASVYRGTHSAVHASVDVVLSVSNAVCVARAAAVCASVAVASAAVALVNALQQQRRQPDSQLHSPTQPSARARRRPLRHSPLPRRSAKAAGTSTDTSNAADSAVGTSAEAVVACLYAHTNTTGAQSDALAQSGRNSIGVEVDSLLRPAVGARGWGGLPVAGRGGAITACVDGDGGEGRGRGETRGEARGEGGAGAADKRGGVHTAHAMAVGGSGSDCREDNHHWDSEGGGARWSFESVEDEAVSPPVVPAIPVSVDSHYGHDL
jgi:hypothetical protein